MARPPTKKTAEERNVADKPTRILLVRHGMTDYVKNHKLAGWTPAVSLNDHGRDQAAAVGARLASERLAAVYSSPLDRTRETAEEVARPHQLPVAVVEGIAETRIGEWTGKAIEDVNKSELWQRIQTHPSTVRFPGGESFAEIQARMVAAVETLREQHPEQTIALVSHSDPIKLVVAFYLGMPLDLFQRLVIQPCSISELHFAGFRPAVMRVNDCAHLPPDPEPAPAREDAKAADPAQEEA
jgi:probable phosphoglycerate mutase